jgi:hypothetical protein
MKQFLSTLSVIAFINFTASNASAQRTHSVKDIFYLLPDTVFTTIQQLNFATKDSFPMKERNKMIEDFDPKRKTFTAGEHGFHITLINEKNNLLMATNGELNFSVKVWSQANNETIIALEGNYKEDLLISQTIKFYSYKGGKITSTKVYPEPFKISLFFDSDYLKKQNVDPDEPTPDLFVVFSKTGGEEMQVRVQKEIFSDELLGTKSPMAKLSYIRIKRPDLILNLQDGKFVITK